MIVSFEQALDTVREKVTAVSYRPATEVVSLDQARGRVLAEEVAADRDYPSFNRSIRDGYAVRAAEVASPPAELRVCGEIRAGQHFPGQVGTGECIAIMTGAPLPEGADAVVMVEYTEARAGTVKIHRAVDGGENVVPQGSEIQTGAIVLAQGRRLGPAELGLLASVGKSSVSVFARPVVAILSTGDEVVPIEQQPERFQIRNSNAASLSAQVAAAGGIPRCLPTAPDQLDGLRTSIREGLTSDLLLMSGGVSAGKYDFVEQVLAELGAEFYFQGVTLRPGKPLVFGRAEGKFFFGLPGNPVSTLVTFALFARPALAVLGGGGFAPPIFLRARLVKPIRHKAGLTAFLPAQVTCPSGEAEVSLVSWHGSGDLVGLTMANCFVVVHPDQTILEADDWVDTFSMVD